MTNAVAAIPEFVDETCGMLAPQEDAAGLAESIAKLYRSPELFFAMSAAAAARVRRESSSAKTIDLELKLFTHKDRFHVLTAGAQTFPVQRIRNHEAA